MERGRKERGSAPFRVNLQDEPLLDAPLIYHVIPAKEGIQSVGKVSNCAFAQKRKWEEIGLIKSP
ncbi:MAG: hypothetical protein A2Z29_09935 [Chloroflexi bacterium RBG_16_56_11]|nr:MAG: hypothetical protein A2Z29_09935 [Chloroflexi bacterium RBG_16_56_11]